MNADWLLQSRKDEESILNQFPIDRNHALVATLFMQYLFIAAGVLQIGDSNHKERKNGTTSNPVDEQERCGF